MNEDEMRQPDHWRDISKQWAQVQPPLKPSKAEIGLFSDSIDMLPKRDRPIRAFVLGVTQELFRQNWPDDARVYSVDLSQAMIQGVWLGRPGTAVRGDWRWLPVRPGSMDIAMCDGGVSTLPYPDGLAQFAESLKSAITPGGLCVLRLYVPPTSEEGLDSVLADLKKRKIRNLSVLKFRMWMALRGEVQQGVCIGDVWRALSEAEPDLEKLADEVGWPRAHLLAINTYKDETTRYYFPDVAQVERFFCVQPGGFKLEGIRALPGLLGKCCPVVAFRRV